MADRIQQRRDTAARWAQYNPILLEGEVGYVTDDPNQYKIGDGVHTWNELPLRGFDGTLVHELGTSSNAAMSQAVTTMGYGLLSGLIERSVESVHVKEYYESIKFIAVVPNEGYEEDDFSIYALTTHSNRILDEPSMSSLNLWILEDNLSKSQGKEANAVKWAVTGDESYLSKIQFIKAVGTYCTLYAIIDWNPIYNYKNSNGKYAPVVWSTNFSSPTSIMVQKVKSDDPRIVNWNNLCLSVSDVSGEFGVDNNKVVNQKAASSLFGVNNGLSFYYESRASLELKAMRIIKRLYFSSFEDEPKEMGIGALGSSGGDGSRFWFGLGYLDGSSDTYYKYIAIDLLPLDTLPTGVKSFYVEKTYFGKMYVEIDFDAYIELGNTVWSWSTPICKVNNILDKDDELWKSLSVSSYVSGEFDSFLNEELKLDKTYKRVSYDSTGTGYIDNSTGAVTGDLWNYFVYKCNEGDTFNVNINITEGAIGTNICSVYAIYNSDTEFSASSLIQKGPQWDSSAVDYIDSIDIPKNGKAIVFCAQRVGSISALKGAVKTLKGAVEEFRSPKYVMTILLDNDNDNNNLFKNVVVDARLILDDESKHDEFWSGSHSFERNDETYTSPKRLWGICQSINNATHLNWYWMYPNGNYIPWNLSFNFTRGTGKKIEDGVEYFVKKVNLDGYSATLHIVIDWNIVPNVPNVFSGNYLNNDIISVAHDGIIQNILLIQSDIEASPTQFSNMTKLNFGVDGDSITAGNQWSYYVTQYLGFANHHNVGVGSATWACRKQTLNEVEYQTQEYDDEDFAGISSGWQSTSDPLEIQKRCNNCAKVHVQKFIDEVTKGTYPEPDIFAFAMGTNDSNYGSAEEALNGKDLLETNSDIMFTMAGAARWCIQKIMTTYPNCRIFVLAPIQSSDTARNTNNLTKIEILKKICQSLSVQFIDMYSNCGITEKLENGTGIYLSDGLHPNDNGRKLMGAYASAMIRNGYFMPL